MTSKPKLQQEGVTLVEVLLVLTISVFLILLGIRQYGTYRRDTEIRQIQANVAAMFQSLSNFYKANCYGTMVNNTLSPGRLHPAVNSSVMYPLNLQSDLVTAGLLNTNDFNRLRSNSFVDPSGPGTLGYVLQFNRTPNQPRLECSWQV